MMTLLFVILSLAGLEQTPGWKISLDDLDIYNPYTWYLTEPMLSVADDGTIFLLDGKEEQIVIIDAKGKLVKRLGTEGKAPGEVGSMATVGWVRDANAFYVNDRGNSKVAVWDRNGNWVKDMGYGTRVNKASFFNAERLFFLSEYNGKKGSQPKVISLRLGEGNLENFWELDPLQEESGWHGPRGGSSRVAFDAKPLLASGSNFIVFNWSSQRSLYIIDAATGKVQREVRADMPEVAMTDASFEMVMESYGSSRKKMEGRSKRPDNWPYHMLLLIDEQDRIWINSAPREPNGESILQCWERIGRKLGQTTVPGLLQDIRGGMIYTLLNQGDDGIFLQKLPVEIK